MSAIGPWTADAIVGHFESWELDADQRWYLPYNAPRFELLLATCRRLAVGTELDRGGGRILDVGAGFQTELLRTAFPGATVDTLGFWHPLFAPREHEGHTDFDLNDALDRDLWPRLTPYPLAVMAEVIEHLGISAPAALKLMRGLVEPGGHLVLQTPNATALHKRLKMLAGRHPYMQLNDDPTDPMHIREYTLDEIEAAGREAGFEVSGRVVRNYFAHDSLLSRSYNGVSRVLPARLRHGVTLVLRAV